MHKQTLLYGGTLYTPFATISDGAVLVEGESIVAAGPRREVTERVYNIHLAERKKITLRWSRSSSDVQTFLHLLKITARRQGIGVFPPDYYRTMIEQLPGAEVAMAESEGTMIASALLVKFGDTLTYIHGASNEQYRALMAPHLLQWRSIQRARMLGCTTYDFYGVALKGEFEKKLSGVTRFKMGFGGTVYSYPGAYSAVYQRSWYLAYRVARRIVGR